MSKDTVHQCIDENIVSNGKRGITAQSLANTLHLLADEGGGAGTVMVKTGTVVPEEGEILNVNFMEPVIPEIPSNVSLVFEYYCEYDYTKSQYLGKTLYGNNRIDLYNLKGKVDDLNLMSGATTILENKVTAKYILTAQIDIKKQLNNVTVDITLSRPVTLNMTAHFQNKDRLIKVVNGKVDLAIYGVDEKDESY